MFNSISHSFAVLICEISSEIRVEKFHIYGRPCIILYFFELKKKLVTNGVNRHKKTEETLFLHPRRQNLFFKRDLRSFTNVQTVSICMTALTPFVSHKLFLSSSLPKYIGLVKIRHNSWKYSAILHTKTSTKIFITLVLFCSAKSFCSFLITREKQSR